MHNTVLAQPVRIAVELKGFATFQELPVSSGQRPSSVDLAVLINGFLVLIEFERSTARIAADVGKARRLGAYMLLIVVPHARLVTRVRTALKRLLQKPTTDQPHVQVMTLGAALNWIASNCPLPSASANVRRSTHFAFAHPSTTQTRTT